MRHVIELLAVIVLLALGGYASPIVAWCLFENAPARWACMILLSAGIGRTTALAVMKYYSWRWRQQARKLREP